MKRVNINQNLGETVFMILIVDHDDYIKNEEILFNDKAKFWLLDKHATLYSLKTV